MDNNDKIESLNRERKELLISLKEALTSDLADIDSSTEEDLDALIDALVDSEYEILKLTKQIDFIDFVITRRSKKEKNLIYKSTISMEEIIDNTLSTILIPISVQNIFIIFAMVSSSNYQEFIKRVMVIILINVFTYKLNSDYLTSNYQHNKSKNKLKLIRDEINTDIFTKNDLILCRDMYLTLADAMNKKIHELAPPEINGIPFEENFIRIKKARMRAYLEEVKKEEKTLKKKRNNR